jgi:LysR family transcriptional regulator of abg operon
MKIQTTFEPRHLVARLRFRHLQLLVELRKGGSLRAATVVLNLTQPALSKALNEIEGAFGFPLFVRGARGMTPTPRGEIAIRGAALLLEELAHVGAEASADPAETVLRIGAPPFLAQAYLPAVLVRLVQGNARVRVQLQEERVPRLLQRLLDGRLDALITSYPTELPEAAGQALRYEKLFDADFTVIASPNHPLVRARRVSWQRLAEEPWVMPVPNSMVRRTMDEVFSRAGVLMPVPVIESTSPVTNLRLVAAGVGLSAVPTTTVHAALVLGEVKRIHAHPAIPPAPVALITRSTPENPRLVLLRRALG